MDYSRYKGLEIEVDGGIARVTLLFQKGDSSVRVHQHRELTEIWRDFERDPDVRVVLLTGVGEEEFYLSGRPPGQAPEGDVEAMWGFSLHLDGEVRSLVKEMIRFEKPVIAAVNGAAVGAGMNLALAADIIVAAQHARFSQVFVKVGLVPDTGGLYLLTRLIGMNRAKELCFTGRMIDAPEALHMGLVNQVVAAPELMPRAQALARELAAGATAAIGLTKSLLNMAPTATLAEMAEFESYALAVVLGTEDHREGIRAFREKRAPAFHGR